jgi:acyl carrier protein
METASTANYIKEVRDFVVNNFLFGEAGSLQDDTSFMESDILDSTGILELVTFLESSYGIKVQDQEMLPENLDSVNRVASFVMRKQSEKCGLTT